MKALSIRQPWAWLIINAGKDIENRRWWTLYRGRVWIHAAKGITAREYDEAKYSVAMIDPKIVIPEFNVLEKGGIIGEAEITGCVTESASPWFFGHYGFMLAHAMALPFTPCRGSLGFFDPPTDVVAKLKLAEIAT